ncbi:hypothetical protein BKA66DRAFT_568157 [Pyrenochaeta sp. MPI-SDFR-AT-0127]|nr:hypothetical protein BKA66DRAFT_568157 [Pyrenochaeta sp. MPI-SDFR-AT-0127]
MLHNPTTPANETKHQHLSSKVLHRPIDYQYDLTYQTLIPQLERLSPRQGIYILGKYRGLTESILADRPPGFIAAQGIRLPSREEMDYLASLPKIILTPPEDGDRKLQPRERGRAKKKDVEGLLAVPRNSSRSKKSEDSGKRPKKARVSKTKNVKREDVAEWWYSTYEDSLFKALA